VFTKPVVARHGPAHHRGGTGARTSVHELVGVGVGSDPEPDHAIGHVDTQCPKVKTYPFAGALPGGGGRCAAWAAASRLRWDILVAV